MIKKSLLLALTFLLCQSPLCAKDQSTDQAFEKNKSARNEIKKELSEKNLEISTQFFEANRGKPGVITLPSGLQYQILKEGTGVAPGKADFVKVYFSGRLQNDVEFDKTLEGKPETYQVDAVIKGWSEALKLMKPGARWRLYVPPNLGYGEQGVPGKIGPNELLVFDLELLSVEPTPNDDVTDVLEYDDLNPVQRNN